MSDIDEIAGRTHSGQFPARKQVIAEKPDLRFPKLQEFKAATNSIYIAARPPGEVKLEPLKDESYLQGNSKNLQRSGEQGNSFKNLQEQTQKYKYFG